MKFSCLHSFPLGKWGQLCSSTGYNQTKSVIVLITANPLSFASFGSHLLSLSTCRPRKLIHLLHKLWIKTANILHFTKSTNNAFICSSLSIIEVCSFLFSFPLPANSCEQAVRGSSDENSVAVVDVRCCCCCCCCCCQQSVAIVCRKQKALISFCLSSLGDDLFLAFSFLPTAECVKLNHNQLHGAHNCVRAAAAVPVLCWKSSSSYSHLSPSFIFAVIRCVACLNITCSKEAVER